MQYFTIFTLPGGESTFCPTVKPNCLQPHSAVCGTSFTCDVMKFVETNKKLTICLQIKNRIYVYSYLCFQ